MKLILPIAGFCIALGGSFFELILANEEHEKEDWSAITVIEKYGYPAESHIIETEDGYFLQLHRIPHGKNSTSASSRRPLLLLHGIITSSNAFLMLEENSFPFHAAERGYDVWLANFRGNHYSKLHRSLSSRSAEFWNFSFHEAGLYDLPAKIDFICNYTQSKDVTLLGHSFGNTAHLVMATTRPEYQKKVRGALLVAAPSVFIRHKKIFHLMAPLFPLVYSKPFINREVFGDMLFRRHLKMIMGILGEGLRPISKKLHPQKAEPPAFIKFVRFFSEMYPSSISMKVLTHYFQVALSGKFQQYDYGPDENLIRYESRSPPEYNLESITFPVSLIYSLDDMVAGEEDTQYLLKRLKNVKDVYKITNMGFRHVDFLTAKTFKYGIYEKALDFIDNL